MISNIDSVCALLKCLQQKSSLEIKGHKKAMISEKPNLLEKDNLTKDLWLMCNDWTNILPVQSSVTKAGGV